jgi:hypothetical protein
MIHHTFKHLLKVRVAHDGLFDLENDGLALDQKKMSLFRMTEKVVM